MATSRRNFLVGLGSAVSAPLVAKAAAKPDFDVIIIGAGAAGIAAARRLSRSGKSFAVVEASDRFGGRCFTDMQTFGRPYDQGAQWVHETESFPVARLAAEAGLTIDKKGPSSELRMPTFQSSKSLPQFRPAREQETEDFYANLVSCDRAIAAAALLEEDISCARALPPEIGDWRPTMEFLLGPFLTGSELADMPAKEYAQFMRPETSIRVREGVGTLMRRLALGSPIQFFTPVTRLEWGSQVVEIEARDKRLTAQAVILTASTGALGANTITFKPALPQRYADAITRLRPSTVERVAIQFGENTFAPSEKLLFEKAADRRTAAAHINVMGSQLCFVQVGGKTCAELAEQGQAALIAFATDWLVTQFGTDIRKSIKRSHATRWKDQPWALGAFSFACAQAGSARKVLAQPLGNRVWFAGEAVHESIWGTVAGAWEMGERAANAAIHA